MWWRARLVDGVDVVHEGVEGLDAWDRDPGLLRQFDRRAEVCFNLHGPPSGEVLIHDAVCFCRTDHLFHDLLPEAGPEAAALLLGKRRKLVNNASDERTDADLLQKVGMVGRFEDDAGRMEGDGSVDARTC